MGRRHRRGDGEKDMSMTTEVLRVSNTGEFLWHKDADAMIANPGPDANPAMMHLFRALRRADAVQAENERLREEMRVLRLYGNKDCTAMADEAMKEAALRREDKP